MEPKERANNLVDKFYYRLPNNGSYSGINSIVSRYDEAKQCALITVDEIVKSKPYWDTQEEFEYWEQVKDEIINL